MKNNQKRLIYVKPSIDILTIDNDELLQDLNTSNHQGSGPVWAKHGGGQWDPEEEEESSWPNDKTVNWEPIGSVGK